RDYRAIALSNYFQNFAAKRGLLGYAFDLEATGRHLVDFHRLMNHWKRVLPADRYREFYYEELVSDPKKTIPEVLDFCGLDFTPEVMEFYRNQTAVRTASVRQVRNPIYEGSKAKWRHYEELLAPVIEIVEGSGVAPYRYEG
ncbi:MAG: sulfotransferase, partial [Mariprofundaceae bacterium]|nr:sulfotransferase [Mariprofundaceae bacterium]